MEDGRTSERPAYIRRRPYHAGSVRGPAPKQAVSIETLMLWPKRIAAYWCRPNTKALAVAKALLGFLGPDGALFPSEAALVEASGCAGARRWVSEFKRAGFLTVIRRRSDLRGQESNAYLLRFPDDPQPRVEQPSKAYVYRAGEDSDTGSPRTVCPIAEPEPAPEAEKPTVVARAARIWDRSLDLLALARRRFEEKERARLAARRGGAVIIGGSG